jgi:hypothetical protein
VPRRMARTDPLTAPGDGHDDVPEADPRAGAPRPVLTLYVIVAANRGIALCDGRAGAANSANPSAGRAAPPVRRKPPPAKRPRPVSHVVCHRCGRSRNCPLRWTGRRRQFRQDAPHCMAPARPASKTLGVRDSVTASVRRGEGGGAYVGEHRRS